MCGKLYELSQYTGGGAERVECRLCRFGNATDPKP